MHPWRGRTEPTDRFPLLYIAQRAHANFTENLTPYMVMMLIAGTRYPVPAAALWAGWLASRVVYTIGCEWPRLSSSSVKWPLFSRRLTDFDCLTRRIQRPQRAVDVSSNPRDLVSLRVLLRHKSTTMSSRPGS
jgi:hypothetical protein